jgi:hypothetical protein
MIRRTSGERQAEAALYRQRSETAATDRMVSTAQCQYDKARRVLTLSSEVIGMPGEFWVRSHHTGKIVKFTAVQPGDSLFDQDGWDGQQCIYRPVVAVPNVDHMVIYNQY